MGAQLIDPVAKKCQQVHFSFGAMQTAAAAAAVYWFQTFVLVSDFRLKITCWLPAVSLYDN